MTMPLHAPAAPDGSGCPDSPRSPGRTTPPAAACTRPADLARRRGLLRLGLAALAAAGPGRLAAHAAGADGGVVIIGHAGLGRLTAAQVVRLYTGRMIELDNQPVSVVNAPAGSALRQRFLQQYLQQDEADYRAYWTVRRHIGKGLPPPELATTAEVLRHVAGLAGAIGYIDAADLRPGLNVLLR